MQIKKTFHFYAAHRNEQLQDKCFSLHGHVYRLTCVFNVVRCPSNPAITTLFSEFDMVDTFLKNFFDHALLIHEKDPLLPILQMFDTEQGIEQKRLVMSKPTSAENLCFDLFHAITLMKFDLARLELQETESSTVIYSKNDYEEDKKEWVVEPVPCECVIDKHTQKCIVCGRSSWDWKVEQRRRKNEQPTG